MSLGGAAPPAGLVLPWLRAVHRLGPHTVGPQSVEVALHPSVCRPHPTPVVKDFHQSPLPARLERRPVLSDVSTLPPSLQPRHYNKAAFHCSQSRSTSLVWGGTWRLGTLFLEGHRIRMRRQHQYAWCVLPSEKGTDVSSTGSLTQNNYSLWKIVGRSA